MDSQSIELGNRVTNRLTLLKQVPLRILSIAKLICLLQRFLVIVAVLVGISIWACTPGGLFRQFSCCSLCVCLLGYICTYVLWRSCSGHYLASYKNEWRASRSTILGITEDISKLLGCFENSEFRSNELSKAIEGMSVERRTSLQESRESLLANVNVLDGTVVDLDKAVDEFSRSAWVAGLQISGIKERSLSHKGDAVELLPSMVELSGLLLPAKTRRECFDPAYGDSLSNYMLARKSRYKWGRRWFALDFTVRILIMVGGCFRVLLQNGAGKFLLGLLPESLRNWWRRQ